ncbi:MAG: M20/M25/M40 family metallo-hydrolase, partial [Planctomycetes bacterium]|nr:M20/M25/M40 family metallo-hydrolase [Planctomycetota bacterium]
AELADLISGEIQALAGNLEKIKLEPHEVIDATGQIESKPLGMALSQKKRTEADLQIFLGIHMDTVYSPDHPFQTTTRLDKKRLGGPGVLDAKGGLVVLLIALEAFEQSPFADQIGWEVLLNPDEEIGSPGSTDLLVQAAQRNDLGLVFEPSLPDGALISSRKGSGNFTLVVRGKTAHAGRDYHLGVNAVHALADYIVHLMELNHPDHGITINVGRIEGGQAVNVVPDLAIGRFNIRVNSLQDQHFVEEKLQQLTSTFSHQEGITFELHGDFQSG